MTYKPCGPNDSAHRSRGGVRRGWFAGGSDQGGSEWEDMKVSRVELMDAGGSIGGDGFIQEATGGGGVDRERRAVRKGCNTCTWHGQCIRYPTNA